LNNLNKVENYRKNPKKLIPSANPSMQSLQLLHSGASITSLPVSESEDDLQSYHWDMSDLNPETTLYMPSGVGSPASLHQGLYKYMDELDGNESEYVGDSEFTENECGNDDVEMEADSYPGLSFKDILAMKDELNYGSDEFRPHTKYNLHPNNYLPDHKDELPEDTSLNGNYNSADYICRDDDDDVIHYGFPRPSSPSKFNRDSYTDTEAGPNILDNMSISVVSGGGGCKSPNGSMSDLSGVCMIEDSEANNSDEENADETLEVKKRLLSTSKTSTQV